jgi:hypothetical protein
MTGSVVQVRLDDLVDPPEFQVRKRPDPATIKRYASAYKAGTELVPILAADIEGALVLVDGRHRVAARRLIGEHTIFAEVITTTWERARWLAAEANLRNGLPLKPQEQRRAFKVYLDTRQHLKPNRKLKSLREIAREFGKTHPTIRKWMIVDSPSVARQYANGADFNEGNTGGPRELPRRGPQDNVEEHLKAAIAAARAKMPGPARARCVEMAREALEAIAAGGPWEPITEEDDL